MGSTAFSVAILVLPLQCWCCISINCISQSEVGGKLPMTEENRLQPRLWLPLKKHKTHIWEDLYQEKMENATSISYKEIMKLTVLVKLEIWGDLCCVIMSLKVFHKASIPKFRHKFAWICKFLSLDYLYLQILGDRFALFAHSWVQLTDWENHIKSTSVWINYMRY